MSKKCSREKVYNIHAFEQDKKHFTLHDLEPIRPKTFHQQQAFESFMSGQNVCMIGSAGTGKSFIALYLALNEVLSGRHSHVYIIRSVTPSKDIGFLPGTYEEKTSWCETIYTAMCDQLFPWKNTYTNLKKANKVKFETTTFLRGATIDNAVIIMDEIQNFQENEFILMMTRVGYNSKVILCGDVSQSDIFDKRKKPNFVKYMNIISGMPSFDTVEFTRDDIVRSGFVKEFIIAKETVENGY